MNDLINELKNDAVDWAMDNLDPDLNDFEWEKAIDKKFAELIVKECVAQIEIEKGNPYRNMGDENRYGIGACVESIRRIKQHFGIEE